MMKLSGIFVIKLVFSVLGSISCCFTNHSTSVETQSDLVFNLVHYNRNYVIIPI